MNNIDSPTPIRYKVQKETDHHSRDTAMKATLNFQIFKGTQPVKTITAKGMESIYAQYKKYCFSKGATTPCECSQETSIGVLYWTDETNSYYLKESATAAN